MINFKEFSLLCGLVCRGEFNERLKLLYKMHLLPKTATSTAESSPTKELFDVVESASEAVEEIDEIEHCGISIEDTLIVIPSDIGVAGTVEDEGEIIMTPTSEMLDGDLWPKSLKENSKDFLAADAVADVEVQELGDKIPTKSLEESEIPKSSSNTQLASVADANQTSDTPKEARSSQDDAEGRPLSPNTTKYILSKSPKSAKKLVKDFVASVMKEKDKVEEMPDMSQVGLNFLAKDFVSGNK